MGAPGQQSYWRTEEVVNAFTSRQRSLEVSIPGVPLGESKGWVGLREGPGFGVEQQPQKLFLFIDITRLLGQVPVPGKWG